MKILRRRTRQLEHRVASKLCKHLLFSEVVWKFSVHRSSFIQIGVVPGQLLGLLTLMVREHQQKLTSTISCCGSDLSAAACDVTAHMRDRYGKSMGHNQWGKPEPAFGVRRQGNSRQVSLKAAACQNALLKITTRPQRWIPSFDQWLASIENHCHSTATNQWLLSIWSKHSPEAPEAQRYNS